MRRRNTLMLLTILIAIAACGGQESIDPFREGRTIYGDVCSSCHGSAGDGGVGPALSGVLETWPDCSDHIEWVSIGSDGWQRAHGDIYGATDRPVNGGMPPHEETLTLEERRLVVAFERVQYGGEERETALEECGVPRSE